MKASGGDNPGGTGTGIQAFFDSSSRVEHGYSRPVRVLLVARRKNRVTKQELAPVFPTHSEFLERYCKAGKFILTGGLTARPAGVVLAIVNSGDELKAMLAEDPFVREQVAEYEVIEFKPSRYHESLASLIALSPENS